MSTKKPRNKAYKPKYVCRNVLSTVFGGNSVTHAEHTQSLIAKNHVAMQRMVQGSGDRDDWHLIVGAINIANVMIEQGIGREYLEQMTAAKNAMLEVGKRLVKHGKIVFTGDELRIVNEAMDIHDAQLINTRAVDVDKAAMEVERRVKNRINSTNVMRELAKEAVQ